MSDKINLLKSILLLVFFATVFLSCKKEKELAETSDPTVIYDSIKAAAFGADDYGMKKYVMALLKRGPNQDLDSARSAEMQRAHMDNIIFLAEEGLLVLAGPFFGKGDLRGIYIFDVRSIEEAVKLTNTDPAIQEGALEMELLEWYGSAALMEVNDLHKVLAKKSI